MIDIKVFGLYILIILNIFFTNFVSHNLFGNLTNTIINPIFWILIFLFSLYINKNSKQRIPYKINKYQTVLIIIMIYLMLYFLQGLFFGYARSPYKQNVATLLTNIWSYVLLVIYQEYVRNTILRNNNNRLIKFLVAIIFTIIDINLYSFINIGFDYVKLFKQTSSIVLPAFAANLLLNYLTTTSGIISCLLYKIPIVLTPYLLPILPNLDWYFISVERTILPFVVYLSIKNINEKKLDRVVRRKVKKNRNIMDFLFIGLIIIFICFVAGILKYKPVAIVSNSMYPIVKRGDVVVVEKKTEEELNNLKKYDIIEYVLDDIIVVHRIVALEKHNDGTTLYITKGDNNNVVDKRKVMPQQILGVVHLRIPYVGYPSVLLNDFFNNTKVDIETGSD